jgi:hypothetical protein
MKHAALTASINVSRARLLLVSSVFLFTFSPQLLAGRTPALDEDRKRGAEKFVSVVESKNPSALLDLFSEQGRSFIGGRYALPKAEYCPAEIRKDFEGQARSRFEREVAEKSTPDTNSTNVGRGFTSDREAKEICHFRSQF